MCNEHKRCYTECLQYIINRSQLMILKYSNFTEAYLTMKRQVENDSYLEDTWGEANVSITSIINCCHF